MTFHLTCVHIIFSLVWVDEWSPFEGWIWILITSVTRLCILFTLGGWLKLDECLWLDPRLFN